MPLDGHSYLVAQGWSGKGTGLRKGAIAKPIAVSQKKTLAGLGKDRDEAFPFWDHLFSAASQAITVKIDDSDVSDSDEITPSVAPVLRRTTTGILSNRRPVNVTPASTSGTSTPDSTPSNTPRLSLIAMAKREAAKRNLYSRFYRGAVLAPAVDIQTIADPASSTSSVTLPSPGSLSSRAKSKAQANEQHTYVGEKNRKKEKKRKAEELEKEEGNVDNVESKAERRERKRRKKEAKAMKLEAKMAKQEASDVLLKESKKKKNKEETKTSGDACDDFSLRVSSTGPDKVQEKEEKRHRKKKKERKVQDTKQVKSRKEKNDT